MLLAENQQESISQESLVTLLLLRLLENLLIMMEKQTHQHLSLYAIIPPYHSHVHAKSLSPSNHYPSQTSSNRQTFPQHLRHQRRNQPSHPSTFCTNSSNNLCPLQIEYTLRISAESAKHDVSNQANCHQIFSRIL